MAALALFSMTVILPSLPKMTEWLEISDQLILRVVPTYLLSNLYAQKPIASIAVRANGQIE